MNTHFFDINSVVIIGATENSGKIGNDLLKNLSNFRGEKFGVNPKGGEFGDIKFYKTVESLPIIPDIAVIVIPAKLVIGSLKECGEKGIKRVIIISAGFKEVGNLIGEEEIQSIAKKYDMRVLGPNCLGYIDAHKNLNLSFGGKEIGVGNIAMISQSGAMAVALTDWANATHLGFSKLISMGNKSDIDENYLLEELENDEKTEVIVMYLESIEYGKKFAEITKRLSKKKPLILVKSGMSKRGEAAASSHTGALSGSAEVYGVAFRDSGIHTTASLEDFFLWAEMFSKSVGRKIPEQLAIVTNAGGPGVMATDHCENNNIELYNFSEEEQKVLKNSLVDASSMKNPLDIIGDATSLRYAQILANLSSLQKDLALMILVTPQTVTDSETIAGVISAWEKIHHNFFVMTSFMGGNSVFEARKILKKNNVLDYDYPRKALVAYGELLKQKRWEFQDDSKDVSLKHLGKQNRDVSEKHLYKEEIKNLLSKEEKLCSPETTAHIMKIFGVNYLSDKLVNDISQIEKVWEEKLNDKLVAKIASPDIAHKTDCGGVIVGISSLEEAKSAYETILKNVKNHHPNAEILGVTFQEMLPKSREVFIGCKRDSSFGEVILVGMGGIFVNVYEDVALKLAGVQREEIMEMFKSLKGYQILAGARGEASINFESLIDIVEKIQKIFVNFPCITEIDINPAFANEKNAIIVDAKLYL